jgi:hypothetical protein
MSLLSYHLLLIGQSVHIYGMHSDLTLGVENVRDPWAAILRLEKFRVMN